MSFLTGLHGTIATILICSLLVVDEAGVPLPFAPSEALLIVAGLLIASGGLSPFVFLPLACVAMVLGTFIGYSWARAVGPGPLRSLAGKLGAKRGYDRTTRRMTNAGPGSIALTRLIPGMRPYATLLAGAAQVPVRTFMTGAVPAAVVWCGVLTFLGFAVGVPAERFLGAVAELAFSGAILVVLGVVAYRSARKGGRGRPEISPFSGVSSRGRLLLAFAFDAGVVATIVAGLDRITRSVLHLRISLPLPEGRYDAILIFAGIALSYILVSRRGGQGETAGERLFEVSYVHRRLPRPGRLRRRAPPQGQAAAPSTGQRDHRSNGKAPEAPPEPALPVGGHHDGVAP
ncbi:MAG: DedA family protein [Candidatus Dormibacteria bacterium]